MSLLIKPMARKSFADPAAPPKYYAVAKSRNKVTMKMVCARVANATTMSEADVYGVLKALLAEMGFILMEGDMVELDDFGTFRLTVNSEGVEDVDDVTSNLVTKVNIRYRAGSDLANKVKSIKIEKASA